MIFEPTHIKFENQQNPNAEFDLIRLEDLFARTDLDHSIYKLHLVEFYILIFMEDGKGYHRIDFTDFECNQGSIITVRKDQLHKFVKSDTLKGSILLFTDNFLVSYLEQLESQKSLQLFNELLGSPKVQLSQKEYNEVFSLVGRMKEEYFDINDDYSLGIIRSELHILINKLFRIKSKKERVISNRKYLNEFIEFQKIVEGNVVKTARVQDFAKHIGVSSKTLNNISKSIVNKTAKEFIDEIRIKQIKRLLINTELSIKEVAYNSGFEETTNFYKYFKRHTQQTPDQFRGLF